MHNQCTYTDLHWSEKNKVDFLFTIIINVRSGDRSLNLWKMHASPLELDKTYRISFDFILFLPSVEIYDLISIKWKKCCELVRKLGTVTY